MSGGTGSLTKAMVVFRKEVMDAARDRRAIYSVLLGSLLGPLMVGFMMNSLAERQRDVEEVTIPMVGMGNAPALVEWLRQQSGVEVVAGPEDAEEAVRTRRETVVVVVSDEYVDDFRASRPAEVRVVSDGSQTTSRATVARVRSLLERYNSEIGAMRLIGRGVSPAIVRPLDLMNVEVSSAQQRAAAILNFIPMFIVLAAFTGGMQVATDSTAGERERGSLEPLLVNPAPRHAFAGGKWMAASVFSALSVGLTTVLCLVVLQYIPLQDLGIRFGIGPAQVLWMLVAVLPLSLLATAIQTYLATFARSFKEAQTYMGFLILIPMLPGLLGTVYPITSQPWMFPVPILGQHVLMTDVMGNKTPSLPMFAVAAAITIAVAVALVRMATGLLRRERIIFGR